MKSFAKIAAAATILVAAGSVSAYAACDGDTGTETALGAVSGAAVGGLASHSIAGAAIGGVAGGLIGNAIGSANNREDCRREADAYYRERSYAYNDVPADSYVDRYGTVHYYNRDYAYNTPSDSWVDSYGNVHYYDYPD